MPRAYVRQVKTVSWTPPNPLRLEEGPITDDRVYAVRSWNRWGDRQKIRALREMAVRYGRDPRMRFFVVNSVLRPAGVDFRDGQRVAATLLQWVQTHIYYANESGEQIAAPWWTIKYGTGDCDDMALLLASMAESVHLPWRLALAGRDRQGRPVRYIEGHPPRAARAGRFYHIYVYLGWPPFRPQQWAAAEPTIKDAPLGFDVVDQSAAGTGPQLPELAGYDPGYGAQAQPIEEERGLIGRILANVEWEVIVAGVIEAVLTGLILYRLTRGKA